MASSYLISVSLMTGCYRHIQISGSATLYKLHETILEEFCFEDDHAHAFFMDNRSWSQAKAYYCEGIDSSQPLTKDTKLNQLSLQKDTKFKYVFDFGEEWIFQCKVLRELDVDTLHPMVVRSVSEPPDQYPEDLWDEEDDDWKEEDDTFPEIYEQDRLNEMYQALPLPEETVKNIHDYFTAAAQLYGIIPLSKLLEIYNQQNAHVSQDDFLAVAEVIRHEHNYFAILGAEHYYDDAPVSTPIDREIVAEWLYSIDDEDYYDLLDKQTGKPFAILPKEEFLNYTDEFYYPITPEVKAMEAFLEKHLDKRRLSKYTQLPDVLGDLILGVYMDAKMDYIIGNLERLGVRFESKQDLDEFLNVYFPLNNSTRKQVNRGYTPRELMKIMGTPDTTDVLLDMMQKQSHAQPKAAPIPTTVSGTPSRNAPCPCGSGRKYKNCCGKKK